MKPRIHRYTCPAFLIAALLCFGFQALRAQAPAATPTAADPASAAPTPTIPTPTVVEALANFHTIAGIDYTQGANGPLKADAFIPNGAGPFPGILFIHGGGWVNGNRLQMIRIIKDLANAGYVGFTIEYDVNPVHYPASYNESLAALRYFREHAAEFHLDASQIAVAGSSAGGELAALVALTPAAGVQGAVILNGVLDLTALGDASKMVTNYLGGTCTTLSAVCKDASPVHRVRPGAPPFYVGHGTADATVPFAQAETFTAALRTAKVPVTLFTATAGPHTYWARDAFYADNVKGIEQFLLSALHRH